MADKNISPGDFIRLFEVKDMPFFVCDTLLQNYRNLNGLFIKHDDIWTCYIPKTIAMGTAKEGVALYGDQARFDQYREEFEEYRLRSADLFNQITKKEVFGVVDVDRFLSEVNRLHWFYLKTEFFYTDDAFKISGENVTLKKNLDEVGQIKNSSREYLNKVFFGKESWIGLFLHILSRQHYVNESEIWDYSQQEVRSLALNKEKLGREILASRQGDYCVIGSPGGSDFISDAEAAQLIESFSDHQTEKRELRGVIANKGSAKGPVKVIKYGYNDFDELYKQIETMSHGDILVAETTSPELILACKKAAAIITNQGGLMSHAAIISRELGIPCVVGVGDATEILRDGEIVEVGVEGVIARS